MVNGGKQVLSSLINSRNRVGEEAVGFPSLNRTWSYVALFDLRVKPRLPILEKESASKRSLACARLRKALDEHFLKPSPHH